MGGPGSCGVLVAKRRLFDRRRPPTVAGGGTVAFVNADIADYEESIEAREDAGTPGILQAIRTGLAFKIKELVTIEKIEEAEQEHGRQALQRWRKVDGLQLMGSDRPGYWDFEKRVSIISFNIMAPDHPAFALPADIGLPDQYHRQLLHPHFVVQVLNDLYGIQGRSGCSCTGPCK